MAHFDDVVLHLYQASAEPDHWEEALRRLENFTGAAGATMNYMPFQEGSAFVISGRMPPEACAEYARDYMAICRRVQHGMTLPELAIQYDYLHTDEAEMDNDPVYDWLGKQGLRYSVATILQRNEDYRVDISLQRLRKNGHVQQADIDVFNRITPHVRQAVALAGHLKTLQRRESFAHIMLDRLSKPAMLLDAKGRVLFLNHAAEGLVLASEDVAIKGGRLTFPRDRAAATRFDRRLAEVAVMATGLDDGWVRIDRAGAPPLGLRLLPLVGDAVRDVAAQASILVVVHDPEAARSLSEAALRELFDLTATEARVAMEVGRGRPLRDAASTMGHSYETARAHMKSIFGKMGINRQQDLMRVLTALAADGKSAKGD